MNSSPLQLLALAGAKDSFDDLVALVIVVCCCAGVVAGLLKLAYRPGHTFRRSEYGRVTLSPKK